MSDHTRRRRFREGFLLSIIAVVGFCLGPALAEANPVDPVDDWSGIGNQVIIVNIRCSPSGPRHRLPELRRRRPPQRLRTTC
jgi:hypothetical protein